MISLEGGWEGPADGHRLPDASVSTGHRSASPDLGPIEIFHIGIELIIASHLESRACLNRIILPFDQGFDRDSRQGRHIIGRFLFDIRSA